MKGPDLYDKISGLEVDSGLRRFIEDEVLPGLGLHADAFWSGFAALLRELTPENERLLARRDELQARIDARNEHLNGEAPDPGEEERFLRDIGYLVEAPEPFTIGTGKVDPEIAEIAGPQLVVPVNNARYALNAVNARWGSLYDALYGTDVLGDLPRGGGYDPERGARVIAWGKSFLDEAVPLIGCRWAELDTADDAEVFCDDKVAQFIGRRRLGSDSEAKLFRHNGLHIEVLIDWNHPIGSTDPAGVADILLESAITAIMNCEDSVAAVDAEEKVGAYLNWLG